jgi:hypothetical protein
MNDILTLLLRMDLSHPCYKFSVLFKMIINGYELNEK